MGNWRRIVTAVCLLCGGMLTAAELESSTAKYVLDEATGRIAKVIRKSDGAVPVKSIFCYYTILKQSGDLGGNEKNDRVISRKQRRNGAWEFTCMNDKLPKIQIIKTYWMENDALRREMKYVNNSAEKIFLQNSTEIVYDDAFRENSYYFGAGYLGPYLPAHKTKSYDRCDEYVQTSKGMVLSNPDGKSGSFANYRVKINDNVVWPWWQSTIGRYRESNDRLYYTPTGWSMCQGTLDAEPRGGSIRYTDCFAFFNGDIYNFFVDVFGRDADFRKEFAQISRPPEWVLDVLCRVPVEENYIRYLDQMFDEGIMITLHGFNGSWADYRWDNGSIGYAGGWITADEWREFSDNLHALSPRLKIVHYGITVAASSHSPVLKEHPEWFRTRQRNGSLDSLFPGGHLNFQTMYQRPGCTEFMADWLFKNAVDYHYDMVYMDEAQQHNTIDWQRMDLLRDDHVVALWKRMRRNSDATKIPIFLNGSGQPFADINFIESSLQLRSKFWRKYAGIVMGLEWFSLFRPTGRIIPLYWYNRKTVDYHNRCLALGWIPGPQANGRKNFPASPLGTLHAAYETGKTLPRPVVYTPDWKRDQQTEWESYTVNRLDSRDLLLSFISRCDQPTKLPVTVELPSLGYNAKTDINLWMVPTKYCTEDIPDYTLSDKENKANYRDFHWYGGTITYPELAYSGKPVGTFKTTLPELVRDDMVQFVVTPAPLSLYTLDDLPLNYFYTKRPKAEIRGKEVKSEREKIELLLIRKGSAFENVTIDGKPAATRVVDAGGTLGLAISVPKGLHKLDWQEKPAPQLTGKPFAVTTDGRTISLTSGDADALYAITLNNRTMTTAKFPYTLPEKYENGTYVIRPAGCMEPRVEVKLDQGKGSDVKLNTSANVHPQEVKVEPVALTVQGVKVTAKATQHGEWNDSCNFQRNLLPYELAVDPEKLIFTAGSSRRARGYLQGLIPSVYAGVELTGAKKISLHMKNTFFNCPSVNTVKGDYYILHPTASFVGFVVDYRVNGKYTTRVDFSAGYFNSQMQNFAPAWGCKKKQDRAIDLGELLEEKAEHDFTLDLAAYAPEGWDGTVWFTVGTTWARPNCRLIVNITGFNDNAKAPVLEGFDPANVKAVRRVMPEPLEIGRLKKQPASCKAIDPLEWQKWAKIPYLLPYPQNKDKYLDQPTEAYLACDTTNLYVAVHCREPRHAPDATNAAAWYNDCVEFHFLGSDNVARQMIVDGVNNHYLKNVGNPVHQVKYVEGDGWYVFAAFPWKDLGISSLVGSKFKFNLVRNRIGSRAEVSTWTPVDKAFAEPSKMGTVIIGRLPNGMGRYDEIWYE